MNPGVKYIMLEPVEESKVTKAGIITQLEDSIDTVTKKGKVLRVGTRVNDKMKRGEEIKEGDIVNYFPQEANQFEWDRKPIIMVHVNAVSTID